MDILPEALTQCLQVFRPLLQREAFETFHLLGHRLLVREANEAPSVVFRT